jgi:hypothetical protein
MTGLDLSGALQGLKVLAVDDLARYKAAVTAGKQMGWGYYFPNLLSKNRPGRSAALLLEDEGAICVFLWKIRDAKPRLDLYLPPTPMNVAVLRRCLERTNDFNGDSSARVMRIDTKDVDAVKAVNLRVRQRREQYVFAPGAFNELVGKRLYTIRRNVQLIERLPDIEVLPYSASHAQACHALLEQWKLKHRDTHGTAGGAGTSRRAIDLAGALPEKDLGGEVVFVDGQLAAFAFGGELRSGLAASFERKCDTSMRGLSYFHFRSFLQSLQQFELINDGSDTGRAGLRQLKESFRPVEMHAEYRGTQPN